MAALLVTSACGTGVAPLNYAPSADGCITPPSEMKAWWAMDNQTDSNGKVIAGADAWNLRSNSAHAEFRGGATRVPGMVADAADFFDFSAEDGATYHPHLFVPDVEATAFNFTGDYSIDVWVYRDPGNLLKRPDQDVILDRGDDSGNPERFQLAVRRLDRPQLVTPSGTYESTGTIPKQEWVHLAVTVGFDAEVELRRVRFYINGVESSDELYVFDDKSHSVPGDLYIGAANSSNSAVPATDQWTGALDEIEVFHRAISQSEITALYKAQSAGKCRDGITVVPATESTTTSSTTVPEGPPVKALLEETLAGAGVSNELCPCVLEVLQGKYADSEIADSLVSSDPEFDEVLQSAVERCS